MHQSSAHALRTRQPVACSGLAVLLLMLMLLLPLTSARADTQTSPGETRTGFHAYHNGIPERLDNLWLRYTGTAFMVSEQGHMGSAAHITAYCKAVGVIGPRGPVRARLVAADRLHDVAIIHAPLTIDRALPLPAGDNLPEPGEEMVVIRFADRKRPSTRAITQARAGPGSTLSNLTFMLIAPVAGGNSGSPLIDTAGRLRGIAATRSQSNRNQGFAKPVMWLRKLLQDNDIPHRIISPLNIQADESRLVTNLRAARTVWPVLCYGDKPSRANREAQRLEIFNQPTAKAPGQTPTTP